MGSHHHIRRQRWYLQAPDRAAAFGLRALLRQDLDHLNAVFERALDAVDSEGESLHIPRLDLQLRIRDSSELAEKLSIALAEQLATLLSAAANGRIQTRTSQEQRKQHLLDFLQHGKLHWHEQGLDAPGISRELSKELEAWLTTQSGAWLVLCEVVPARLEDAVCFFLRLLNLIAPEAKAQLAQTAMAALPLTHQSNSDHVYIQRLLLALAEQPPGVYPQHYLQALQLGVLVVHIRPSIEELLTLVQRHLGQQVIQQLQLSELLPPRFLPTAPIDAVSAVSIVAKTKQAQAFNLTTTPLHTELPAQFRAFITPPNLPSTHLPPVTASLGALELEQAPGLRVHMAGLVLLYAYLPRLFSACRIEFDDLGRITPPCLARAAALLHRLATGREEIHEFELGFIKPLLGLSPDVSLAVAPGLLDEADLEEYATLLAAVISHWSVLRSTSADGLRISFLQRQGLLHDKGGHWQLNVESEAFDVLLAQLPWSISLIKLPWMTKPIFTDWPTR